MRLAFENFVYDSETREVLRGGAPVALSPKAFELLELLARERPKAISKERIHAALWPDVFVSDASLTNVVSELRSAFRDTAREPHIIRTVPRFGYSFVAKATEGTEPQPSLAPIRGVAFRLLWERREIALEPGEHVIGRDQKAAVWVDDPSVSRHHARIVVRDGHATLEDLGSKNGTLLAGKRIAGQTPLSDGDEICIGRATLIVRVLEAGRSTQTASDLPRATKGRRR